MEEVEEISHEIYEDYKVMIRCFEYYAAASSGDGFVVKLNAYSDFLDDCQIPQLPELDAEGVPVPGVFPISRSSLDTVFLAANLEHKEAGANDEDSQNDDRALMRFEFVEALIRIALEKFIPAGTPPEDANPSETVNLLIENHIKANLEGRLIDKNQYREKVLYKEAISDVLMQYKPILRAIYDKLCKEHRAKSVKHPALLTIKEWMGFMDRVKLFDTSFPKREGRCVFSWCKMRVADELKHRKSYTTMPFVDFLEALPRIADLKAVPTDAMMDEWGAKTIVEAYTKMNPERELAMAKWAEEHEGDGDDAADAAWLVEKVTKIVEYVLCTINPEGTTELSVKELDALAL